MRLYALVLAWMAWAGCANRALEVDGRRVKTCARDPQPFGPPWPARGAAIPDRSGAPSALTLTQEEGEKIRCVLLAHITDPAARVRVDEPFRSAPETWQVGAPWESAEGPRIGEYWVQRGDTNDAIVLTRPLGIAPHSRYSIGVTMVRRSGVWQVVTLGGVVDHAAR